MTIPNQQQPIPHVAGAGRVRRMGNFGPAPAKEKDIREVAREMGADVPPLDQVTPDAPEAVTGPRMAPQALVAIITLIVGAVLASIGIGATFGWSWGITTLGVIVLASGTALAFTS